jgi:hypothetical protein
MLTFTVAQKWRQSKCPSADGWINKMWYIHTWEYYSGLKRSEILLHATTNGYQARNKPDAKRKTLYDFTYMRCLR